MNREHQSTQRQHRRDGALTGPLQPAESLRQQTEREQLVAVIAQRIRQSLDLDAVLNATVKEVRQFLQADRVVIFHQKSNLAGEIVAESVGSDWPSDLAQPGSRSHLKKTTSLYQQRHTCIIHNLHQTSLSERLAESMQRRHIQALLSVPISQENQFWGVLSVGQCSGPRHWQPFEIDLLQQLAAQVAIAIQQSELYQRVQLLNAVLEYQVQDRTDQLQRALDLEAVLKRITDKVRDSLDENQILQAAVRELASALEVRHCDTALYDLARGEATIGYECTTSTTSSRGRVLNMAEFSEFYSQLLRGEHFQFCELHPILGPVTALACSMQNDQGVLGDLWLFKHRDDTFSELEIRLVQQVANQCAIALRQARLYQAAQSQVQELEKLNRLKDDFLSTVSHELRTPMTNIKMAIQMLEVALSQDRALEPQAHSPLSKPDKATYYLRILQDECQREINLINNLLDLQRLYSGCQPLVVEAIQLQDWLPKVVEPFHRRAHARQQRLQIDCPSDLPLLVSDASGLGQILAELLNNACKYTPADETITVTAQARTGAIQIGISNSGIEIPLAEQSRIFEKFYRIPSNDPWKEGGTGLGLALVQKLVEHLGGMLRVESSCQLTCFTVELSLDDSGRGS